MNSGHLRTGPWKVPGGLSIPAVLATEAVVFVTYYQGILMALG